MKLSIIKSNNGLEILYNNTIIFYCVIQLYGILLRNLFKTNELFLELSKQNPTSFNKNHNNLIIKFYFRIFSETGIILFFRR